jgi:hypothetical protein
MHNYLTIDAFILSYHLLWFSVTNFIMKAFINGRKLFGTPFYPLSGTEAVGQLNLKSDFYSD